MNQVISALSEMVSASTDLQRATMAQKLVERAEWIAFIAAARRHGKIRRLPANLNTLIAGIEWASCLHSRLRIQRRLIPRASRGLRSIEPTIH